MKKKILIVDDDAQNREILKEVFEEAYELDEATDGQEAISKYLMFKPDIILLDVMMPNLDGRAVLTLIRNLETSQGIVMGKGAIPIIMLTAHKADWLNTMENGLDFYVVKPFEANKLRTKVDEVLALSGRGT